jgi:hypothetical protein
MEDASLFQRLGAGGFGTLIGWYLYYVNRYRSDDVRLSDIGTLIAAIGGTAVLALFPAKTDLFGAYGIGLCLGFFGYLFTLLVLVSRSKNFDSDWFLDGRRKKTATNETTDGARQTATPMGSAGTGRLPGSTGR